MAVGMFSIFESVVQNRLECRDGFATVRECLERENENDLNNRFAVFVHAINVLKHGRGPYRPILRCNGTSALGCVASMLGASIGLEV
jgi:hypothetical protein